ncbi:MAG TPA: CAP domain-containing protein [Verrucomicrobiae bacterium]|nr:CAP domain-containing protein [Verrucomicrobiae bacterium]
MSALWRFLQDHLVPHEGNGHHPKLLRHKHLFGMSALLVGLKMLAIGAPILLPGVVSQATAITPSAIVSLTNATRRDQRETPLTENALLDRAAQAKADDMVNRQYFAHEAPDGKTAMDLILAQGYQAKLAAENLAVRYTQAESVEEGWLLSPTHRENIVNPEYRDIGVGVAQGSYEGKTATFVVQLFGRVLDAAAAPAQAAAVASPKPISPATQTWQDILTGSLRSVSQAADALAIILIVSLLLFTLSVKFHEKHLATVTEAFMVIGMAIVLRLF